MKLILSVTALAAALLCVASWGYTPEEQGTCETTGKDNGRVSCTNSCTDTCAVVPFTVVQGDNSYDARSCVCEEGDDDGEPDPKAGCCDIYVIDLGDGSYLSLPIGGCDPMDGCEGAASQTCVATFTAQQSGDPPQTILVATAACED